MLFWRDERDLKFYKCKKIIRIDICFHLERRIIMYSPKDVRSLIDKRYPEESIIENIDEEIERNLETHEYNIAYLDDVIPLRIRNTIVAKYCRCGWKYVCHITGKEEGTAYTGTKFYLSEKPLPDDILSDCYMITKSEVESDKYAVYYKESLVENIDLNA